MSAEEIAKTSIDRILVKTGKDPGKVFDLCVALQGCEDIGTVRIGVGSNNYAQVEADYAGYLGLRGAIKLFENLGQRTGRTFRDVHVDGKAYLARCVEANINVEISECL